MSAVFGWWSMVGALLNAAEPSWFACGGRSVIRCAVA